MTPRWTSPAPRRPSSPGRSPGARPRRSCSPISPAPRACARSWATSRPTPCAASTTAGCATSSRCTADGRSRRSGTASWRHSTRQAPRSPAPSISSARSTARRGEAPPRSACVSASPPATSAGRTATSSARRWSRRSGCAPPRRRGDLRCRCRPAARRVRSRRPFEDAGELALRGLERPCAPGGCDGPRSARSRPLAAALAVDGATALRRPRGGARRAARAWARSPPAGAGRPRQRRARDRQDAARGRARAHAADLGGVVLYGHATTASPLPAQPFAEALSAYAAACPPDELRVQLARAPASWRRCCRRSRPRCRESPSRRPPRPRSSGCGCSMPPRRCWRPRRSAAPVLLVLDDLHWADELCLLLLRHVLRADDRMRCSCSPPTATPSPAAPRCSQTL